MTRADVIVIGGGPAGSSAARALVQAGLDVVVFDRARFPRDKTCAGWITPAVVDLVQLPIAEYGASRVCQPITGFRTARMGRRLIHTRFGTTVSYGIRRVEFDEYLLRRSGATVVDGTPVTRLAREGGRWLVNDTHAAPVIIGAAGHQCPVARHLGARPSGEHAIAAQEVEFRLTPDQQARCRVAADTPELYLCPDLRGYGWCFRKGDHLNVGLGRLDSHDLPRHVRAFRDELMASGGVPPDMPTAWKGHAYLLRDRSPRPVLGDGALLVGDAAGLAATMSGEGIRPAIESGLAAARAIIDARGRDDRDALASYESWLNERFPRRAWNLDRVPESLTSAIVGGLLGTAWFTRRVLLERWFLQAA
ncbi:MAG: NAD(P)/FAD-dependent oxidoreductase [Vicinamibacterales bacterium]